LGGEEAAQLRRATDDGAGGGEDEGESFEVHIFMDYVLSLWSSTSYSAGVATPDPGEAPPMAVLSVIRWLHVNLF
jgi:hypothetical protein